jgi:type I restriction enzyme S subunit
MKVTVPEGYIETKLGIVPETWKTYKLSNVLKLYLEPLDMENENKYELITVRRTGRIDSRGEYLGKDILVKTQFYIRENNFVISKRQVSHGAFGLVPKKLDGAIVSNEYNVFKTDESKVNTNFLHYFSRHPKFWQSFYNYSDGVHIEKLLFKTQSWLKLRFPFPPLKEQEKITQILKISDELIIKQEELIKKKEELKKGLIQKLLSGEVRFDEFTDEWTIFSLNEVLKERKTYQSKGLELEHVSLTKEGVVPKSERYERDFLVKEEDKQYKITKLNDICYNPANLKFGVICKNTYGDGIFSPIYVTFETKKGFNVDFLRYFLTWNHFIKKVRRYEEGTVYERMAVNPKDFLSYKTKLPSLLEQQKIAEVLSLADDEINLLKNELEELKLQKKGLMQKLLTGEVRVKV